MRQIKGGAILTHGRDKQSQNNAQKGAQYGLFIFGFGLTTHLNCNPVYLLNPSTECTLIMTNRITTLLLETVAKYLLIFETKDPVG